MMRLYADALSGAALNSARTRWQGLSAMDGQVQAYKSLYREYVVVA